MRRVLLVTLLLNVAVAGLKVVVGHLSHSLAMVADGYHSLVDSSNNVIGLVVACLISIIAPLTQCCLNPARDFGPRLFTYLAGWGSAALPGPNGHGFFTVYILAPILGAVAGGGIYEWVVRPAFSNEERALAE